MGLVAAISYLAQRPPSSNWADTQKPRGVCAPSGLRLLSVLKGIHIVSTLMSCFGGYAQSAYPSVKGVAFRYALSADTKKPACDGAGYMESLNMFFSIFCRDN